MRALRASRMSSQTQLDQEIIGYLGRETRPQGRKQEPSVINPASIHHLAKLRSHFLLVGASVLVVDCVARCCNLPARRCRGTHNHRTNVSIQRHCVGCSFTTPNASSGRVWKQMVAGLGFRLTSQFAQYCTHVLCSRRRAPALSWSGCCTAALLHPSFF